MAVTRQLVAHELRELIAALDRRTPRVEHAGEASIARDAAALREKAVKRLAEITGEPAPVGQATHGDDDDERHAVSSHAR